MAVQRRKDEVTLRVSTKTRDLVALMTDGLDAKNQDQVLWDAVNLYMEHHGLTRRMLAARMISRKLGVQEVTDLDEALAQLDRSAMAEPV